MSQAAVAIRVYTCALDPWQDHVDVCERWVVDALAEEGRDIQSPAVQALEGEVINRADSAALQVQQQCLDSYQSPPPQVQTGVHVAVATRIAQGRVESADAAPSKVLVGRTSVAFAEGGGCPAYPMAMFVTDAKEGVIFFSPESTLRVIDSAPDTCFHLGNTQTGRAWEFVATPTPLPGTAFRGADGVIYSGIWQNATNSPTAENSIELDTIEFIPNRLAVVIPRYGMGVEPDVHVPAALGMARVTGSKATVPLAIRPPLTGALPIGTAGIKLEEVNANGVTSLDAQLPLWQNGSQVFTKDALGVTPVKFKRRILNSGENTYRVILLTIAWASRYDVYADLYTVKTGRTFSKSTASVLYIPGQTVGDLPIPPLTEKVFLLRDLSPQLIGTFYKFRDQFVIDFELQLSNPTPFEIKVQVEARGQYYGTVFAKLTPPIIVKLGGGQTRTIFGQMAFGQYQSWITSIQVDCTLSIYSGYTPDNGSDLQYKLTNIGNPGFVVNLGSVNCVAPMVTATAGQIINQSATPPLSLSAIYGPAAPVPPYQAWMTVRLLEVSRYTATLTQIWVPARMSYKINGNTYTATRDFYLPGSIYTNALTGAGFSLTPHPAFAPFVPVYVDTVVEIPNIYCAAHIKSSPGGTQVAANTVNDVLNQAGVDAARDWLNTIPGLESINSIEAGFTYAVFLINALGCPASLTRQVPQGGLHYVC